MEATRELLAGTLDLVRLDCVPIVHNRMVYTYVASISEQKIHLSQLQKRPEAKGVKFFSRGYHPRLACRCSQELCCCCLDELRYLHRSNVD